MVPRFELWWKSKHSQSTLHNPSPLRLVVGTSLLSRPISAALSAFLSARFNAELEPQLPAGHNRRAGQNRFISRLSLGRLPRLNLVVSVTERLNELIRSYTLSSTSPVSTATVSAKRIGLRMTDNVDDTDGKTND